MKIKSLILAFPVLCLACSSPSSTSDPANQIDASPIYAKKVVGVDALSTDANYDEPCNILGEEYVRSTFNLDETAKLEEVLEHDGCEFEWAGNKVLVSFGGKRPYSSIYLAEYTFDKMYQGKPSIAATEPVEVEATADSVLNGPKTEGTNAETSASETVSEEAKHTTDDKQPQHGGVSAATPHLTKPAVTKGSFEAVSNVGDKAVWNASTGAMHVLYNNHIINVTVETKDKAEVRKEHAQSLVEVLIDKIAENEYVKRL
ncbi:6,7-dimethyl-8-ribityllumazine synthase [Spirosoma pollinicola]|uniref:DUF3558 domain-containing protein n=1 Tax=Spirosoma pollinicola TaxID=2057025 RepID=A0A2K8Z222_9BACT|nr:hypothetical protein [Spirosoma pollinicola]AUD03927.1 hypothetical protein CWM47_20135 [Spirosoma pollinicola]